MKKGEATRARIVDAAAQQASVRGLAAVSLNDVASAIGLSKSGVFKHFDSKDALHQAVLDATIQRYLEVIWAPAVKLPPGRERVSLIFDRWLDWVEKECGPGGCLIMVASVEFDDQPGPIRDFLQACHRRWHKTMVGELRALTDPPLPSELAEQAAFDAKSYILGFREQRRLLDDSQARQFAKGAFDRMVDRLVVTEPA